jgi:diguanylate cyclase (GGDEF)-like protein
MSMPRPVRWAFAAIAAWFVAATIRNGLFTGIDAGPAFDRFAHDVVLWAAGLLCLARAWLRRDERLAWWLIGLGILAWSFGELYYTGVLWTAKVIPIPSPADVGYLLMPPLTLAGAVVLARSRFPHVPSTHRADGLTAALAVGAVSAAVVFETVSGAAEGKGLSVGVALAYPLLDIILIGFHVGVLAATGWRFDRTWALLGGGVCLFWAADSVYLVQTAADTFVSDTIIDVGWWAGLALIAFAAWQPATRHGAEPLPESARLIVMPLLFALVGLGVLIYGCFAPLNPLAVALAAAAMVAVMGRLILTFQDNTRMLHTSRDEALTDALTGLPNRRALARHLERSLADAGESPTTVLALFDLDGFKLYNDTFGHPAGDALLVRLGGRLGAYLDGRGEAFRMGGDEFCAIFEPGTEVVEPIVEGARGALSETGEGFSIGCSYGSILLPIEAGTAAEALRVADQRMYAQKNAGRASASRQSRDVLVRAIAERHPELSTHLDGVADLAAEVARALAVSDDQVEQIRHAAELHDVGKVAIPDDIIHNPGPLDEVEWEFMRRHTLIGERIVAAAPALQHVASLVRSSHERWDGDGYPDRLAGHDIPLGSRIVAVADAFDAMTAHRSYSTPRTTEAALAELRRCSGAQFDPMVVEAFIAVLAQRSASILAGG